MRKLLIVSFLIASTLPLMAQSNTPPANTNGSTPAVNTSGAQNPDAPVAGANSFTESQAKSRIEAKGYSSVSALTKDDKGVWRGKAMQNEKSMNVSVDFQGNVVAQ